jgi:hypothetical protein
MYCICCKNNNVKPTNSHTFGNKSEMDILWSNPNQEMINNGIISIINAGYGSKHDGDKFILAICDECIEENLKDNTLLYYGNYMYNGESFIQEEINRSKKEYNRRKNLDNLV